MSRDTYNFTTFRRELMKRDAHFHGGPKPGEEAPDFALPLVGGGTLRISEFRTQKPVLLEFGSISCPMTAGARSGLIRLFAEFETTVRFFSVYVREAHPGERYPHHTSDEQKMRHAREWVEQDKIPWGVAVDDLEGTVHQAYGELPNSIYLIDRTGRVAFRALWAGQEELIRDQLEQLLSREANGEGPVILGEAENRFVPMLHGAAEFEHSVERAGERAVADFRREAGGVLYGFEKLMSKFEPVINPGNRDIDRDLE